MCQTVMSLLWARCERTACVQSQALKCVFESGVSVCLRDSLRVHTSVYFLCRQRLVEGFMLLKR